MARSKKKKDFGAQSLALHKKLGGKLETRGKVVLKKGDNYRILYSPGVGAVAMHLAKHPEDAKKLTIKRNTVAVISDGSAVLGIGNRGPYSVLPVIETKAMILKEFADVDAFPIGLASQDPERSIETIVNIAPAFGAIHLEDFKAPECFYIEAELKKRLTIPVMHDDQHATAIVATAGLINAAKVVKKDLKKLKVVIVGAGAAGTAIAKLLVRAAVRDVIVLDRQGIVTAKSMQPHKRELARLTNPRHVAGALSNAIKGADAVIGVSGPGSITARDVRLMAPRAIVLALAGPVPEIMPDEAKRAGAAVIATGRADYPNQINNALAFPGVFRGALDHGVTMITDEMKLKAAQALAKLVPHPTAGKIIPSATDPRVVPAVAKAIR